MQRVHTRSGQPDEAVLLPELPADPVLRERPVHEVWPCAGLPAGSRPGLRDRARGILRNAAALDRRRRSARDVSALQESPGARRLQLGGARGRSHDYCRACRLNHMIPNLDHLGRQGGVAQAGDRQAPRALHALRAGPAGRAPGRAARMGFSSTSSRTRDRRTCPACPPATARASSPSTSPRPTIPFARRCASRWARPTGRCWGTSVTRSATTTGTGWSGRRPRLADFRARFGDETSRLRRRPAATLCRGRAAGLAAATSSARTRRCTRGRTGRRPGRTTCTSSTRSRPPAPTACRCVP